MPQKLATTKVHQSRLNIASEEKYNSILLVQTDIEPGLSQITESSSKYTKEVCRIMNLTPQLLQVQRNRGDSQYESTYRVNPCKFHISAQVNTSSLA